MLPAPRRILIIMLRRIGDVLLTTPAARALRRLYPTAVIDFLAEPPAHELLAGNPDISNVLVYRKGALNYLRWLRRVRAAGYDWVIDYMGNPRTAALTFCSGAALRAGPGHVAHRWAYSRRLQESATPYYSAQEKIRVLAGLGITPDEGDCLPRLAADAESEKFADDEIAKLRLKGAPLIGLVPASRRKTRRWPAASYAELGRRLRDGEGARLMVFWGPGEYELARSVREEIGAGAVCAPATPRLRQLAALISRCTILVTNCNGPKHIAVARGVPTLTIHGSSDPRCWNPQDQARHPVVRRDELGCIGCLRNSCPTRIECLNELPAERVYAAARKLLRTAGVSHER
ncbi:MAG: glycosyltransferase family 9 protein [Elusimicrobiota bacterium]